MNRSEPNENDDGISMYLSFDNTTDSTSTYKTIACDNLTSFSDLIENEDSKGNTTLHNTNKLDELSGIMKDCISVETDFAERPLPFSKVLREFNAVSSTPSKIDVPVKPLQDFPKEDELTGNMQDSVSLAGKVMPLALQSPMVTNVLREFNAGYLKPSQIPTPVKAAHQSPAKELFELSRKCLERGAEDLNAVFENLVSEYEQENKENTQKSSSEDSMPSFSKTSILQLEELKNCLPSVPPPPPPPPPSRVLSPRIVDVESIMQTLKAYNISSPTKRQLTPQKVDAIELKEKPLKTTSKQKLSPRKTNGETVLDSIEVFNVIPSSEMDLLDNKAGTESTSESVDEYTVPTKTFLKFTADKKVRMSSAVRKPVCEPDLISNRPSRILTNKITRFSMAFKEENIGDSVNAHVQARPVLNRKPSTSTKSESTILFLPTSEKPYKMRDVDEKVSNQKNSVSIRNSLGALKTTGAGRKSIATNLQNEKRPTPKRMPPIAKTTLNCATRKSSRPSLSANGNVTTGKRRSVFLLQTKNMSSPRKRKMSMMPAMSSNDRFPATQATKSINAAESFSPAKKGNLNTRKSLYGEWNRLPNADAPKFVCAQCGAFFHLKSTLEAHKKTHRSIGSPDVSKKRALGGSAANNGVPASNTVDYQCKFCDKHFMLERTLHIHLMEHCPKIPASERRKLNFTEMDHVKKEETPYFRMPATRPQSKTHVNLSPKDRLSHLPVQKSAEMSKFQYIARALGGGDKKHLNEVKHNAQNNSPRKQAAANKQSQMAPPQSTRLKMRSAHSGVYRTPNKDIPCVSCRQSFKSVLDYTNHMMATHAALDASLHSLGGGK